MLTPAGKRKAVVHLVDAHGMSERRACLDLCPIVQFFPPYAQLADGFVADMQNGSTVMVGR